MKTLCIVLTAIVFALVFGAANSEALAAEPHLVVMTDGSAIYLANDRNLGRMIRLTCPLERTDMMIQNPCIARGLLWYDRTEVKGTGGQRLFYSRWIGGYACKQRTSDQWGYSQDEMVSVSDLGVGCIYLTDRRGEFAFEYDSDESVGPGYGHYVAGGDGAACWGLTVEDKYIAYIVDNEGYEVEVSPGVAAILYGSNGINLWDHRKKTDLVGTTKILFSNDGLMNIDAIRISVDTNKRFLISDDWGMYFLIPGQDAIVLTPTNVSEATISPDGSRVLFIAHDDTAGGEMIFSAAINEKGELSDTRQVADAPFMKQSVSNCRPTWCPDSMFFNCSAISVKLNFAKPANDSLTLVGSVMVPEDVIYDMVTVTLGGLTKSFYLGDKEATLHLVSPPFKGVPRTKAWSVTCSKEDLAVALAASGFVNATISEKFSIDLTVVFSNRVDPSAGDSYTQTLPLRYTARAGKTGTATK